MLCDFSCYVLQVYVKGKKLNLRGCCNNIADVRKQYLFHSKIRAKIIERYAYMLNIEDGFENSEQICKMIEDVVEELGINQKLEKIMIKHTPSRISYRYELSQLRQRLSGVGDSGFFGQS